MATRLTKTTALEAAYTEAKTITDSIQRGATLAQIMDQYRAAGNTAKVKEIGGLIRTALGESTDPEGKRILGDTLYYLASVSDAATVDGQKAWGLYVAHFESDPQQHAQAYLNAINFLPDA